MSKSFVYLVYAEWWSNSVTQLVSVHSTYAAAQKRAEQIRKANRRYQNALAKFNQDTLEQLDPKEHSQFPKAPAIECEYVTVKKERLRE